MKKQKLLYILLIYLFVFAISCSESETTTVTIHINSPDNTISANIIEHSIIDRFLRFFTTDATAQTAPANLTSLTLNITGPGMTPITGEYAPTTEVITVKVDSGPERTIELLASTPSATLRGATTQDLTPGATTDIQLSMKLYETKLVIPDYDNNRVVQIDDQAGTNWIERSSLPGISQCRPYDIAFDNRGRIYIANYVGGSGMSNNGVVRLDDINSTESYIYPESAVRSIAFYDYGIAAIAVDLNSNYIYYAASNNFLYRCSISDNTTHEQLTTTGIGSFTGITINDQGVLYISGYDDTGYPGVFIYDPVTQSISVTVNDSDITDLVSSRHLLLKPPYLYVANPNTGVAENLILQLDMTTLDYIAGHGMYTTNTATAAGEFYGPRNFCAIRNGMFSIIDEGPSGSQRSRLVFTDDMSWTNWTTYGAYGLSGEGYFDFYFNC